MVYKRSTSFSRYQGGRTVQDLAKEKNTQAKATEFQRKQSVSNFEKISNDQLSELGRINTVQSSNDSYEVNNLRKFSKSLDQAIAAGTTVAKEVITRKQQSGSDFFDRYEAGDEEAKEIIDLNQKQIEELEKEIIEFTSNQQNKLSEVEIQNKRLTLENKIRLNNARKLGPHKYYGFAKRYMQERDNGFLPWFMNSLKEDKTVIVEGQGQEGDPNYVPPILVNQYNDQDRDTQIQIEKYLRNTYVEQSAVSGVNNKIINKYLREPIRLQANKWRNAKLQEDIKNQAAEEIQGTNTAVYSNILSYDHKKIEEIVNGEVVDNSGYSLVKAAIQAQIDTNRDSYSRLGTSPGKSTQTAAQDNIYNTLKDALSSVPSDYDRKELLNRILNDKFLVKNLGDKTLEKHFGSRFNQSKLLLEIESTIANNRIANSKIEANATKDLLSKEFQFLIKGVDENKKPYSPIMFEAALDKAFNTYGHNPTAADTITKFRSNLKKFQEGQINDVKARELILNDVKLYGKVTLTTQGLLTPRQKEKFSSIVLPDVGAKVMFADEVLWHETNDGQITLNTDRSEIHNSLNTLFLDASADKNSIAAKDPQLAKAKIFAINTYLPEIKGRLRGDAEFMNDKPDTMTEGEYIHNRAVQIIKGQIQAAKNPASESDDTNPFRIKAVQNGNGNVFIDDRITKLTDNSSAVTRFNEVVNSSKELALRVEEVFNNNNFSGDIVSNVNILDQIDGYKGVENLEKRAELLTPRTNDDGLITEFPTFINHVANSDGVQRSILDSLNLQRKFNNLPPISSNSLAPNLKIAHQIVNELDQDTLKLIASNDIRDVSTGIDKAGLIDINLVANALGEGYEIGDGKVTEILNQLKDDGKVGTDYNLNVYNSDTDIGAELRDLVRKYYANELIQSVAGNTDNKLVALRQINTLAQGGSAGDWYDSSYDARNSQFINNYYSGGLDYGSTVAIAAQKELNIQDGGTVNFKELSERFETVENRYPGSRETVVSIPQLRDKLQNLEVPVQELLNGKINPDYVEYTKNKAYLESKLFVLDHINADLNLQIPRGSYGLYRGQSELSALVSGRSDARLNIHIKNVLGDTEYDRITKKVANDLGFDRVPSNFTATWLMSPTSQGSTIAKQNQFVQAMIRELIKHPEFKVISESGT